MNRDTSMARFHRGGSVATMLASARWAGRLAWGAQPRLFAAVAALGVSRSLLPAGLALTARGLVNSAVHSVQHGLTDISVLVPWLALGLILTLVDALASLGHRLWAQRLRDDLQLRVTTDILTHAARLDVASYDEPRFHDLLQRAKDNPAEHVSRLVTESIGLCSLCLQIASLLAVLLWIEPLVPLILAPFALPYLRHQWRLARRQHATEEARTRKRRWTGYFLSRLTSRASIGEVKLLGLAPLLTDKFRRLMVEFRDQDAQLYRRSFTGSALFATATIVAIYGLLLRVGARTLQGAMTIGDMAIVAGASARLRTAFEAVVGSASEARKRTLSIGAVIDFLQLQPQHASGTRIPARASRGEIRFENVTFTYPGATRPALRDIDLRVRGGEIVALVGENGAGKTTLLHLLACLYHPQRGAILLDGIDVREVAPDFLRAQIAYAFQAFGKYEATAGENIAYGDWGRLLGNTEQVAEMGKLAGVHDLITSMPHGYDTVLGRLFGTHELSGGQWQRLAMARAFARNAPVLLLDEPTANLDARAENELLSTLRQRARGRTTMLASHRFSTITLADRMIVLRHGRIVESGTHVELLARGGDYARLYSLQHRRSA